MDVRKTHTYVSHTYHVEDGPVEDTEPGYLTQGKFVVDYMSLTYHDGVLFKVYLKGPGIKTDGSLGKNVRARTYFGGGYPAWVKDYITG
jgi:hypothetical protein